jgi:hypothetical protein
MAAKKAVKKSKAKKFNVKGYSDIPTGLKYPWSKPGRLWNILWILIPILGLFAIIGYVQKIVRTIVGGDKKELPAFGNFWDNMKAGFWVVIKLIPLIIVLNIIKWIPILGPIAWLFLALFFVPYIVVHFLVTGDFASTFDYQKVVDDVFGDIKNYVLALLKTIVYGAVYYVASLVLVGIPCLHFGGCYFMAEFYANKN